MRSRPRIAITIGVRGSEWRAEEDRGRYLPYAAAIEAAGGDPVMLGLERAEEVLDDPAGFLAQFDGILFSGGNDVDLASYPNPPSYPGRDLAGVMAEHSMRVDEGRDEVEIPLVCAAFEHGTPALGICRGLQVVNVALGGQLILHLDPERGHSTRPDRSSSLHPVRVERGTRLGDLLGADGERLVNSRHHQAADVPRVAEALRIGALAADGVVEAVEAPDHPWFMAVQWHPERPEEEACYRLSQPLFAEFVNTSRRSGRR